MADAIFENHPQKPAMPSRAVQKENTIWIPWTYRRRRHIYGSDQPPLKCSRESPDEHSLRERKKVLTSVYGLIKQKTDLYFGVDRELSELSYQRGVWTDTSVPDSVSPGYGEISQVSFSSILAKLKGITPSVRDSKFKSSDAV